MDNNKSHKYFLGDKNFSHEFKPAVGILVVNLGTPDDPTPLGVKNFLREFLNDPRIIEVPKIFWKILLHTIILNTRPKKVSKLYKSIWTKDGSPLLVITKSIVSKLRDQLLLQFGTPLHVEMGMRYGNPSIADALKKLKEKNCHKIIFLPLFGQYSATTVGAALDALFDELKTWRWIPEIRTINQFHDTQGYISSLANNIRRHWEKHGRADKLLMSFHGMPMRYILAGDPYYCHCLKTGRLIAEKLEIPKDKYQVTFQSQFGKEEWIKPATDKTLEDWAKMGLKSVDVICPGFIADCLETLEEIEEQNKEVFLSNGGEKYHYIPSVNDGAEFINCLVSLIEENAGGWLRLAESWKQENYIEEASSVEQRYEELLKINERK